MMHRKARRRAPDLQLSARCHLSRQVKKKRKKISVDELISTEKKKEEERIPTN